jgi:hypothetical protein
MVKDEILSVDGEKIDEKRSRNRLPLLKMKTEVVSELSSITSIDSSRGFVTFKRTRKQKKELQHLS